jgi:hypothetical protein
MEDIRPAVELTMRLCAYKVLRGLYGGLHNAPAPRPSLNASTWTRLPLLRVLLLLLLSPSPLPLQLLALNSLLQRAVELPGAQHLLHASVTAAVANSLSAAAAATTAAPAATLAAGPTHPPPALYPRSCHSTGRSWCSKAVVGVDAHAFPTTRHKLLRAVVPAGKGLPRGKSAATKSM